MEPLELTKESLSELYLNQGLTETEIAKRYGTYQIRINRLRRKWGIPTILKSDRLKLPPLTERQKQILVGSLLGDGYMNPVGASTARFSETHSVKQEGYVRWMAEEFHPFVSGVFRSQKVTEEKTYPSIRVDLHTCREFRNFYETFYPRGIRVFPPHLHELMTPLVLAVWYMDDGNLNRSFPRISFGLGDKSLKRAIRALRILGLKPVIHEDRRSANVCTIRFPGQREVFFDLVRPHIPECMDYKLPQLTQRQQIDLNAKTLTSEIATDLYIGGVSPREIAELYGIGTSTVRRRLESTPKIPRHARKNYTQRAAEIVLGNIDPDKWQQLPPEVQTLEVERAFRILRKTPFPYPPMLSAAEIQTHFEKLRDTPMELRGQEIRPQSPTGLKACYPFFPNRYKAIYSGISAYESWHRESDLRHAIKFQLRYSDPVLPHRVLRAITMQVRTPTIFRPAVAKFIYERYGNGGRVYDPCMGYGGRMLGALAAGVEYVGTDVEGETVEGNRCLAAELNLADRVTLTECPAEDYDVPDVDLVFTSPPYFDREVYSQSVAQSSRRYTHLSGWVKGFLLPVIEKAYRASPVLALNIADIKSKKETVPLVSITIKAAERVGYKLVEVLTMPIGNLNRSIKGEPILVFRR